MQKQQSAVELLTTYAWAILIVAVFVAAVAVLATTRPPAAYLASSCNIQPLLPCTQTLLTTNAVSSQRFVVQFTNNLGTPIQFAANAINLTTTNIGSAGVSNFIGNCTPSFATQGAQVLCTVYIPGSLRPSPGTQTSTQFTLKYNLCNGNRPSTCQTTSYKSTGISTQNAAPSNVNFFTLNIITQPTTGSVVLNGVTYPNGVNAVYIPGNYIIFGVPPSGYRFNSWSVTGSSVLSSTSLQNATLALKSNGTLTANFIQGATTTTVTFITTSTSTTSLTSTSTSLTSSSTTTTSTSTTSTSTSTSTTSTTSTSTSTTSTSTSTSTTSTSTSTSTTSTIPAPVLDAHASVTGTTGAGSATTPGFTTSNLNDMLVALVYSDGGTPPPVVSDSAGSTWNLQYGGTNGLPGQCGALWVYYALPGHTVSGDTVTTTMSSGYLAVQVIAITNGKVFDPNGSLHPNPAASVTYSTSNPNDFIIGSSVGACSVQGFTISGLTALDNIGFQSSGVSWYGDAYKIVSTTQTNAAASISANGGYVMTVFAVSST